MTELQTSRLIAATLLVLGTVAGAYAQGYGASSPNAPVGGTATSGTGVKTGKGPLSQPIPPATSTTNPQQNPNLPSNVRGPALTNPPSQPFGSSQ